MAEFGREHPAKQPEVRLPVMQLIEDEGGALPHIVDNRLHTLRYRALI